MDSLTKPGLPRYASLAVTLLAGSVLLGACATTATPPSGAQAEAREAIRIAQDSGAREHAPAALDDAQRHIETSEAAVADEEMVAAERSAERATVTAKLATASTEAAKARRINQDMEQAAQALREEMQRTGEQQ